jgi:CheY-like chemotaxis protein
MLKYEQGSTVADAWSFPLGQVCLISQVADTHKAMHVTNTDDASLPEILLIEDRKPDRDLFELALTCSGVPARLTHARSVTEAVQRVNRMGAFAGHPLPTIVILDLIMSGQNGMALLRLLHRWHATDPIPVVVLTASSLTSERCACDALGVSGYQVKPTLFADLVAFVSTLPRHFPPSESHGLGTSHLSLERVRGSAAVHLSSQDGRP